MGIIQEYVAQRRKKKLEDVTHALEQLKHENVATDSFKLRNTLQPTITAPLFHSGKDLLFIGILLVCVVILVITTFYYRSQYAKLDDDYQEKVDKLATLETELKEKLQDLDETQSILKEKEASEKELSGKSRTLEAEIEDLENEINTLQKDITTKKDEMANLTITITDQKRDIDKWKGCIQYKYNGNLSVC